MVNSDEIVVAMIALACEQALLFDDRFWWSDDRITIRSILIWQQ